MNSPIPITKPAVKSAPGKIYRVSLSGKEKITLVSNLSTMLSAGIPILEAVDSLLEDAKGNVKKVLEVLKDDLVQGKPVNFAFAKFPLTFDKVTTNIIKASEEAGTLDVILKDLTNTIRKEMEFGDKIKSAMVYPLFILGVLVGVLTMILVVVMPKISVVFKQMGANLPLPTRILIFMSDALLKNTILVIAGLVAAGVLLFFFIKMEKRLLLNILLSLPVVSQLAMNIDLTRFSRSLYLLLNAGLPITSALVLTEEVVLKKAVAKAIAHAKDEVTAGRKLSKGFKDAKQVFPSMMIKITEAGEKSGTLDKSMLDISEFFSYETDKSLKLVTALMEPLMLVLVGVVVGGIMLAIITPIYGLVGQVHSR